jgi:hypothetical protein
LLSTIIDLVGAAGGYKHTQSKKKPGQLLISHHTNQSMICKAYLCFFLRFAFASHRSVCDRRLQTRHQLLGITFLDPLHPAVGRHHLIVGERHRRGGGRRHTTQPQSVSQSCGLAMDRGSIG